MMSTIPTLQSLCLNKVVLPQGVQEEDERNVPELIESSCRQILQQTYSFIPGLSEIAILRSPFRQLKEITFSNSCFANYLPKRPLTDATRQLVNITRNHVSNTPFYRMSYKRMRYTVLKMFTDKMEHPELGTEAKSLFDKFNAIADPQKFREETLELFRTAPSFIPLPEPSTEFDPRCQFLSTLLRRALSIGDYEFIPLLFKAGAPGLSQDPELITTALYFCFERQDLATAVSLIQADPAIVHILELQEIPSETDIGLKILAKYPYDQTFLFNKNEAFITFLKKLQEP